MAAAGHAFEHAAVICVSGNGRVTLPLAACTRHKLQYGQPVIVRCDTAGAVPGGGRAAKIVPMQS
jgi:hypothetical protein